MKNLRTSKIGAVAVSILLILAMAAVFTTVHGAVAIPTYSFINVAPNPCGVGQEVTVDFWLAVPVPGDVRATNLTVYVTPPGGSQTSLGTFTSDLTGGTYTIYTPATTGNYTFQMVYGGQALSGAYKGDTEAPSTSNTYTLDVQQSAAQGYPNTPLPTNWWQTPVSAENVQSWYAITGPWLGLAPNAFGSTGQYNATGNDNPYTMGPTTGHILWTKPWQEGGVAGGAAGGTEQSGSFWTTCQYEPKWNPVVMNGIEYATWYTTDTSYNNGIVATDLYNGQTMWVLNTTNTLLAGYMPFFESPNQYGVVGPYIITSGTLPPADTGGSKIPDSGTQFNLYDALTGKYVCSVVNGTSPTFWADDSDGNLIGYYVNNTYNAAGTTADSVTPHLENGAALPREELTGPALCAFNLTMALGETDISSLPEWTLSLNSIHTFDSGLVYATIIPEYNGNHISLVGGETNVGYIASNVIVLTSGFGTPEVGATTGYAMEAGFNQTSGQELWIVNRTETPYTRISQNYYSLAADGVYVECNENTFVTTGYSLNTGTQLWQITLTGPGGTTPNSYDEYGIQDVVNPTTGIIYMWGLGGDIWAINMLNGNVTWQTSTTILQGSPGTETPYGIWPIWVQYGGTMAGGNDILYLSEGHEYSPPLFHGAQILAINGTNGQLIWSELGFADTAAENSYDIMTALNSYDGQIYAYGQGPTATTVNAPDVGVTTATPITITGTVMDVSPGASQQAVAENFPHGLPAVSDASMSQFMEAVYEQQPMPSNITGVPVTLSVLDSNGNYRTIGTTTTNALGDYSYTWCPDITGNYTVYATFAGTNGYYGSSASIGFYASSPAATSAPTAPPVSGLASTNTVLLGVAAIIVVLIVGIAALAAITLRKHA